MSKLKNWYQQFTERQRYTKGGRTPFFKLAGEYLPANPEAIVLDIGAGEGEFASLLNLGERYEHFLALDSNSDTVKILAQKFKAKLYTVPESLPFTDRSVDYVHCSHLIEHLYPTDLYKFFKELNRVLKPGGVLVISTPLIWPRFYDDLSHVRPYNPQVFINYFCQSSQDRTNQAVTSDFKVVKLAYRYRVMPSDAGWGSRFFIVDLIVRLLKALWSKLGFRYYLKNGYTLVLQKAV